MKGLKYCRGKTIYVVLIKSYPSSAFYFYIAHCMCNPSSFKYMCHFSILMIQLTPYRQSMCQFTPVRMCLTIINNPLHRSQPFFKVYILYCVNLAPKIILALKM